MELALIVWLISTLSGLHTVLNLLILISSILSAGLLVTTVETFDSRTDENIHTVAKKWLFRVVPVLILATLLSAIVPTSKTGWMMAGAYVGQMAVTSDSAKKLGKIVEIKLEEVLDEATEQAKIKSKSINKPKE
jgi:hypothetical protein